MVSWPDTERLAEELDQDVNGTKAKRGKRRKDGRADE
jgi:hypothetical protein